MIIQPLLEAESLEGLRDALSALAGGQWQAKSCHYLVYDDRRQTLWYQDQEWELSAQHQPGVCALTLRPSDEQGLVWPEGIQGGGSYKMCQPLFHWGSLNAVLCLSFDERPKTLDGLDEVAAALGILGERIRHREESAQFMSRCLDFFAHAVETRGAAGHVERCCRLVASLSQMLDCSAQVQAHLMEAAQCHDLGLLTFPDPKSSEAVREHARVGATLLRSNPDMHEVALLVENHHERYDGSGTPAGKGGEDLPLECWLFTLVEDFVEGWESSPASYESKVTEFFTNHAKHHHPDVVDALCGLVDSDTLRELFPA